MGGLPIYSLFLRFYITPVIALIAAGVTFVALNRKQSVYQKSFIKKVNKIKDRQKQYENEKNETKLDKRIKKHAKAVKRLERRIKRAMFFNRNIVITNPTLTENANLALPNQTPFTFESKLDDLINKYNAKHKRQKTVNCSGKKTIAFETRPLTDEEIERLERTSTEIETNGSKQTYSDIYKSEQDILTH